MKFACLSILALLSGATTGEFVSTGDAAPSGGGPAQCTPTPLLPFIEGVPFDGGVPMMTTGEFVSTGDAAPSGGGPAQCTPTPLLPFIEGVPFDGGVPMMTPSGVGVSPDGEVVPYDGAVPVMAPPDGGVNLVPVTEELEPPVGDKFVSGKLYEETITERSLAEVVLMLNKVAECYSVCEREHPSYFLDSQDNFFKCGCHKSFADHIELDTNIYDLDESSMNDYGMTSMTMWMGTLKKASKACIDAKSTKKAVSWVFKEWGVDRKEKDSLRVQATEMEEKKKELESELEVLINKHATTLADLEKDHASDLQKLTDGHASVVDNLKKNHSLVLDNLKKNHSLVLDNLKKNHSLVLAERDAALVELNDALVGLKEKNSLVLAERDEALVGLEKNHSLVLHGLQQNHTAVLNKVEQNHTDAIATKDKLISALEKNLTSCGHQHDQLFVTVQQVTTDGLAKKNLLTDCKKSLRKMEGSKNECIASLTNLETDFTNLQSEHHETNDVLDESLNNVRDFILNNECPTAERASVILVDQKLRFCEKNLAVCSDQLGEFKETVVEANHPKN